LICNTINATQKISSPSVALMESSKGWA